MAEQKRAKKAKGKKAAAPAKKQSKKTTTSKAIFHSSQAGVAVMRGSKKCPKDGCKGGGKGGDDEKFNGLVTIHMHGAAHAAHAAPPTRNETTQTTTPQQQITPNTPTQPYYPPSSIKKMVSNLAKDIDRYRTPVKREEEEGGVEKEEEHHTIPYMRHAYNSMSKYLQVDKQDNIMVKNGAAIIAELHSEDLDLISRHMKLSLDRHGSMRENTKPFHHNFIDESQRGVTTTLMPPGTDSQTKEDIWKRVHDLNQRRSLHDWVHLNKGDSPTVHEMGHHTQQYFNELMQGAASSSTQTTNPLFAKDEDNK
jgi:hypothetical protein